MRAIVFGASGGIGSALVEALAARRPDAIVFAVSRAHTAPKAGVPLHIRDYDDESLENLVDQVRDDGPLDLCLCAIGLLSDGGALTPERSYRHQTKDAFEQVFAANVVAPALIAKHVLPAMPRDRRAVFAALSARVGSIEDNQLGGWHAYRASKAALNMLIKNYAIEQARRNPDFVSVGLHPGTVDTKLSKPFQSGVSQDRLFSPTQSATYLLDVIEGLAPHNSGHVYDWAGARIPA
ncbi:MAG: SDR family NAD(P)-dependent oxidoreductase [Pseudomonadota bacterium]